MTKQTKSYRLSDLTRYQLEELSKLWGTSLTETLTLIVDRAYQEAQKERSPQAGGLFISRPQPP